MMILHPKAAKSNEFWSPSVQDMFKAEEDESAALNEKLSDLKLEKN